jgi:hypothetical protein
MRLADFGRRLRALLLVFSPWLIAPPLAWPASFPPWFRFRTLDTPHVSVHFEESLEPMARQAASLAEEILARHEARYGVRVRRIHVVLSDADDDPNGFASPLPYPLVHLRAAAPDGTDDFGNYEGWLRLVLTHELAHIVHLEEARGLVGFGRKILGRAPFLFPNTLTPVWMLEGLATYEETEGTAFGRGRNPDSRMVVRMAALEDRLPVEDVPAVYADPWPAGHGPYLFGEAFLRDLSDRHGDHLLPDLARVHAGRIIPFADELTCQRVTGASFHSQWREWMYRTKEAAWAGAERLEDRGLTPSLALTRRGVVQTGPRMSPDGSWIAYTSRTLTRFRAIRLVRPDGLEDRWLAHRNGGDALSWTPDGRTIVYDEPEIDRLFTTHSDLKTVEVKSGRVRRLTRGLRAREPDVAPDGRELAFVRRMADRSEIWRMSLDGGGLRALTESAPETQWSEPSWSPDGRSIVAARWMPGGWLDIVLIEVATGAQTLLTEDRARDMEPTWTPDGRHILFRSDRDGVSNLYALRLEDRALLRVTNVLGGAFHPSVAPDGRSLAYSEYTAAGYDVHVMGLALDRLEPADAFVDAFPAPRPLPDPATVPSRPYRPLPTMLPRFWSPFANKTSREWQFGAASGGADPLLRHAYALEVHRGLRTGRVSAQGLYQYDRFRPTLLLTASDKAERDADDIVRTQEVGVRATLPITRSFRKSQSLSVAWRFKREKNPRAGELDLGGIETAWSLSSVRQYPFSISPVEGWRLRAAVLKEAKPLGSDVALAKASADARAYWRLFAEGDALALRVGGGTTFGSERFRRSFAVGGFPGGSLFDVVQTNASVLRGYGDDEFSGRSFAHANAEYRFPLAHPERGYRLLPAFLRHLHGAVFVDAAAAWTGALQARDVKTGAGIAVGSDLILGHGLPFTVTAGVARGFSAGGETRGYLRAGLAF